MAGSGGPMPDARAVLARPIASSPTTLITPQIVARSGFAPAVVRRHLLGLEAGGAIGMMAGRPRRWYWIGAAVEQAAVA